MRKAEIRKIELARRKALSVEQVEEMSGKLLDQFVKLDFSGMKSVHVFLPIEEKREPDTFLFVAWLAENHPAIKIIVPKADFETALMSHHIYEGKEDLQKNMYHILEPQKSGIYQGEISLVIVPLLGFDLKGYRVGYGKGFYDRFLTGIETRKIGLSFFEPVDVIEDVHEQDIRLDACITPGKTYIFS
jgi:5-formyltetrahydrofolate cyclo-ligase